jgi:cold shock CspA family protein
MLRIAPAGRRSLFADEGSALGAKGRSFREESTALRFDWAAVRHAAPRGRARSRRAHADTDGPAVWAGVRLDRDEPAAQYGSSPDSPPERNGFEPPVRHHSIIPPDQGGKDIFVQASALDAPVIMGLAEGQRVAIDVAQGRKGAEAVGLRLI